MPLIHRRIFCAKAGATDQLVQLMQDGNAAMVRYGSSIDSRILTDHMTVRSDRVVVEWDVDDMGSMDATLSSIVEDPEGAAYFGGWMEKLNGLIHSAEGEFWDVR